MNGTYHAPETYVIEYAVYYSDTYESHTIKVKNCTSELQAKIKLGDYVKKKYPSFKDLVIYKCNKDFMGMFGNIDSNPFNFK
jgi:hypothetical protein